MFTIQEAKKALSDKYPELTPISAVEYDSRFVFDVRPKGKANVGRALNSTLEVDKVTGEIATFMPKRIPIDEYRRGVKVLL